MASVLLTTVGGALGAAIPGVGAIAGPLLATLGGALGTGVDSALGLLPERRTARPRLNGINVQDSRDGAPLPIIYGTLRLAGNIIWSSNLIETARTQRLGGGKAGSARSTAYQYSVHLAAAVAAGPVSAIHRIWADSKLIYNASADNTFVDAVRIYSGSATQMPDALLESFLGVGNVPAFRHTAYVVLENLRLENFGNRIPNLTFEVEGNSAGFAPAVLQQQTIADNNLNSPVPRRPLLANTGEIIIGGTVYSGLTATFRLQHFGRHGNALVHVHTANSASFATTGSGPGFCVLAPDGEHLAISHHTGAGAIIMIYNVRTRSFGPAFDYTPPSSTLWPAAAVWLTNTQLLLKAETGSDLGVVRLTRAGLTLNAPSNAYTALFTSPLEWPTDDWVVRTGNSTGSNAGLPAIIATNAAKTELHARFVSWQNNQLVVRTVPAHTLASVPISITTQRFIMLPQGEILRVAIDSDFYVQTLRLTTTGFVSTRAPFLASSAGTALADIIVLSPQRINFLLNQLGAYYLVEMALSTTSFTSSAPATICSGTHTPALSAVRALPLNSQEYVLSSEDADLYLLQRGQAAQSLGAITNHIAQQTGLTAGDLNTSSGADLIAGFAITQPMAARRALESLFTAYPFTLQEVDGQLVLQDLRTATATAITHTGASFNTTGAATRRTRAQAADLPSVLELDYLDATADYALSTARASLSAVTNRGPDSVSLPIALAPAIAQQAAERGLANAYAAATQISLSTTSMHLAVDAGDVITLNNTAYQITKLRQQGGLLQLEATGFSTAALTAAARTAPAQPLTALAMPSQPSLLLLDLPALRDSDDAPGIYLAAIADATWPGGVVLDDTNTERARLTQPIIYGTSTTALPAAQEFYVAPAATVTVALAHGTLQSVSYADLINGANLAALGSEIVQFQTATLTGSNTYQLSGLLRGRYGTTPAAISAGADFYLLQPSTLRQLPLTLTQRNSAENLRLITLGQTPDDALPASVAYQLITLRPYAPVRAAAMRDATTGDITLRWQRRARVQAGWANYIDVPIDASTETYELDIYNGSTVVRTLTASTPTISYTAAQQIADFGSTIGTLNAQLFQTSALYGRGLPASIDIIF